MLFFRWIALAISSGLFTGFVGSLVGKPGKAGGTAGSVVVLIIQLWLLSAGLGVHVSLMLCSFFVGWIVCGPGERLMLELWGPRKRHTGEEVIGDFNETCVDEVHGQFLAALPLWIWNDWPLGRIPWLLVAFVIFRICDAKKPWPVNVIEQRFKGTTFGIMIDDTIAALLPVIILVITHFTYRLLR